MSKRPPGLRVKGSRATEIIPLPDLPDGSPFASRREMRMITIEEFMASHRPSGTVQKQQYLGANVSSHSLHERVAYEFGYYFVAIPERFVTWGEVRSEPDVHAVTEAGWHAERYASIALFPGDEVEYKFISAEINGEHHEGIGIVIRKTSAQWLPRGYMVFCIIAEWNCKKGKKAGFKAAVNPC